MNPRCNSKVNQCFALRQHQLLDRSGDIHGSFLWGVIFVGFFSGRGFSSKALRRPPFAPGGLASSLRSCKRGRRRLRVSSRWPGGTNATGETEWRSVGVVVQCQNGGGFVAPGSLCVRCWRRSLLGSAARKLELLETFVNVWLPETGGYTVGGI